MSPFVVLGDLPVDNQPEWNDEDPFDPEHSSSLPNLYDEATTLNHVPHTTHIHHGVDLSPITAISTHIPASGQSGPGEEQGAAGMMSDSDGDALLDHGGAPSPSEVSHIPAYSHTSLSPAFTTPMSNLAESPSPQHTSVMDSESPSPPSAATTAPPHTHHSGIPPAVILQHHPHFPGNSSPTEPPSPGFPIMFEFPLNPSHHPALADDFFDNLTDQPSGGLPQPSDMPFDSAGLYPAGLYPAAPIHFGPTIPQNPIPGILTPQNAGLLRFLALWVGSQPPRTKPAPGFRRPWYSGIMSLTQTNPSHVSYRQLRGDQGDLQGIDWSSLHVTRKEAREYRLHTYRNFVNIRGSDVLRPGRADIMLPSSESYFRFRNMHIRRKSVRLNHFQLRHILASSTRNRSYYPDSRGVRQINPLSGKDENIMDLRDLDNGGLVSTLAATSRVLVAGTFNGEYCMKNLESSEPGHHTGRITDDRNGITTHVQVYSPRFSSAPVAAFASNDKGMRILDLTTGKFLMEAKYNFPINCAALSPDKRLRVMVGDHYNAVVANAETGEVLRELGGHRDYGFACDWADDGWTVATGSQDMAVKIWDARRWCNSRGEDTPVTTLRSEMAGVRSLRFSPLGSGRRVLVAAEEADYVSVIDARGFEAKQTFDMFGEVGGIDFCNGGGELQVLCCDGVRGGLMRFERCDWGREAAEAGSGWGSRDVPKRGSPRSRAAAELPEGGFDWGEGESRVTRRKRAARSVHLEPF